MNKKHTKQHKQKQHKHADKSTTQNKRKHKTQQNK